MRFKAGQATYRLPRNCIEILNVWFRANKLNYALSHFSREEAALVRAAKGMEVYGFSRQYVNQVANGKKPISDKIAKAAGYVRQWVKRKPK